MSKRRIAWRAMMLVMVTSALLAARRVAAEDISTTKDLTAVIALHGQPCGQVVQVKQQGENDYLASCQDGNRYRVFLNAEGRVVVQKQ
jgi:hypothetical protein